MATNEMLRRFFDSYDKEDIITVNIVMEKLKISRPTATDLIQHLWNLDMIEPLFTEERSKCYTVSI